MGGTIDVFHAYTLNLHILSSVSFTQLQLTPSEGHIGPQETVILCLTVTFSTKVHLYDRFLCTRVEGRHIHIIMFVNTVHVCRRLCGVIVTCAVFRVVVTVC